MPTSDRSRKLFVRSLLAGTSTLATLMGAQSLALIDSQPVDENFDDDTILELTLIPTQDIQPTSEVVTDSSLQTPQPPILSVKPSITIFRQAGSAIELSNNESESNGNPVIPIAELTEPENNNAVVILPPQPIELQAPEPIVIIEEPVVIVQAAPQQQQSQQQPAQQPKAEKKKKPKKSKSGSSK
jgi:hypothetical protein